MKITRLITIVISIVLIIIFSSCGNSESSYTNDNTTFDEQQKSFLYSLFKTEYLWSNKVEDVEYDKYETPQEMIDALKYEVYDKWSYSQTRQEYDDFANQVGGGFGCSYYKAQIRNIKIGSPCDKAGLKRGDYLINIDDEDITTQLYINAEKQLDEEVVFTIIRDTKELNISIAPTIYSYDVTQAQIFINSDGRKVAHLIFDEFTSASSQEIDEDFTYFKENDVEELVIDLRYNYGGSVAVASILMDKIAAYNNDENLQFYLKFNQNNSYKNSYYYFDKDENSLDLDRVFFLTSNDSVSASEILINGLKPYMDVVLVGSKTRGKPVGMQGRVNKGLIYWLINFLIYNSQDYGEYFSGIEVDCSSDDNLSFERTDENDYMLSEALHYIENGNCR